MTTPPPSDRQQGREVQLPPITTIAAAKAGTKDPLPSSADLASPRFSSRHLESAPRYSPYLPSGIPSSTPTSSTMAAAAILTPTDILPSRVAPHTFPVSDKYGSSSTPRFRESPMTRTSRLPGQSYDRVPGRGDYPRRDTGKEREHVRYEPYPMDRRDPPLPLTREDERIVLPPPSLGPMRHHHDAYTPRHVLPPVNPRSSSTWDEHDHPPSRRLSQSHVQLPSLRAISGDPAAARRPGPSTSTSAYHDRPAATPRDPYRPPTGSHGYHRSAPYPQPVPTAHHPYTHYPPPSRTHPYGYPYRPLSGSRVTHPPPDDRRSPPLRVKHEPDLSPPLEAAPLSSRPGDSARLYASASRYSPSAQPGSSTRRGSAGSLPPDEAGEGKDQVVGQTRRLAHLMSEQKRRE